MIRILIADPDSTFRNALSLLLNRKLGLTCISEAADMGTLIQSLLAEPPELLLLGWSLYGTPGPEICRLLRKSHPSMKIVLLSVNPEDEAEAQDAGADFIQKGSPAEEILASLKKLISPN
jgi:DNA-binding NarL/FixJ family response regulator